MLKAFEFCLPTLGKSVPAGPECLHEIKYDGYRLRLSAFDILVDGDDDLRRLPLHLRKTNLERLLARRAEGIFVNPFERGEIGPDLFRAACGMG